MRRITDQQRRMRLGRHHHLAHRSDDVVRVASDLVGFHSSDPASVYLSARARMFGFETAVLEDALYERRALARLLGMRRTMFVVPVDLGTVMEAACTRALVPGERKRLTKLIAEQITPDAGAWLDRVEADTLAALRERGEATAKELTTAVPDLASKLRMGEGKAWGVTVGMSTRVLFLLATEAKIVRGRPLGTWLSSQYRWVPTELWFGDRIVMDAAAARTELARRWLATFGPATLTDLRWWAGWTAADARHALDAIGAVEVEVTTTAYVLPDDSAVDSTADCEDPEPWVALLPSLDPAVMGWKEREWFLGAHQAALFDRNGNVGPTVWSNGRIVGGWAQRPDGDVVVRVLEDVGNEVLAAIDLEAGSLTDWLGGIRLTPRMRTPLERELST